MGRFRFCSSDFLVVFSRLSIQVLEPVLQVLLEDLEAVVQNDVLATRRSSPNLYRHYEARYTPIFYGGREKTESHVTQVLVTSDIG